MDIGGQAALVTGANRGLGRAIAAELRDRGATVYAAARAPERVDLDGVRPVRLDLTDPASITQAAQAAGDVTILVNNAGSTTTADVLTSPLDALAAEMDTHYWGTLHVTRAFVPIIEHNGGGAVLNILSVLSWLTFPSGGAYAAAKSAEWSLTNSLRHRLVPRGITVSGLHVGFIDTDATKGVTAPKNNPADVARVAVDGIAAGTPEIVVDDFSRDVRTKLAGGVDALYPNLASTASAITAAH